MDKLVATWAHQAAECHQRTPTTPTPCTPCALLPTLPHPRAAQQLRELCEFLEAQMGLPAGWLRQPPPAPQLTLLLLYVSASSRIQACVAAEAIKEAFCAVPQPLEATTCPPLPAGVLAQDSHGCSSAAVACSATGGVEKATPAAAQPAAAGVRAATSLHSSLALSSSSCRVITASATLYGTDGGNDCGDGSSSVAEPAAEVAAAATPGPPPRQQQQQQVRDAGVTRGIETSAGVHACSNRGSGSGGDGLVLDRRQRVRAVCGVRMVWVSVDARRRGLASRLLDACRCHFMPGYVLPRGELAFRCDGLPAAACSLLACTYDLGHRLQCWAALCSPQLDSPLKARML